MSIKVLQLNLDDGQTDEVILAQGSNITISQIGKTITITSSATITPSSNARINMLVEEDILIP